MGEVFLVRTSSPLKNIPRNQSFFMIRVSYITIENALRSKITNFFSDPEFNLYPGIPVMTYFGSRIPGQRSVNNNVYGLRC